MTDTPENPPEWAQKEACERSGVDWHYFLGLHASSFLARAIIALARTIAKHEQPPIDEDLVEAREVVAKYSAISPNYVEYIRQGDGDNGPEVALALTAIKRGRDLERGDK